MAHRSMTFNGIRKPYIYLPEGREKAPFSPLNRNVVKYPGGYRLKDTEADLLSITQPIEYIVRNDEEDLELKDDIASWLVTEDLAPLTFDDEPGRTYYAEVRQIRNFSKEIDLVRSGLIEFVSYYASGAEHDLIISTEYSTKNIEGQKKVPWTSKTTFDVDASQYVLETNKGGRVVLNFDFIATDLLEFDYHKRKVTLNGENLAEAIDLQTNWFKLEPGEMSIRASHQTTITYTERYH
ncbi:distal tail protein Dit [Sediminibacillus sp. JSM 1682029]|uniref:distal tail protein Dit n=1 Tax=Sediminibacillus sp. JSM 1682029 TaxID=3229857 RepID=UPI003523F2ED